MRIPFSVYLMPVFWLSVAALPVSEWRWSQVILVFGVLHLLLYPASNGYNSLIDKDEDSVGGIEKPPPVTVHLAILVAVFDILALVLSFFLNIFFGFAVAVYWLVSKAYSSPVTRLKKMPLVSWLVVAIFQGGWTVLMVWFGVSGNETVLDLPGGSLWPITATLFLAGSYPLTQIYQHESDLRRGDVTLSAWLGIRGTFLVASGFIFAGSTFLLLALWKNGPIEAIPVLIACTIPSFLYFFSWMKRAWNDPEQADFENTMRFNTISSFGLSLGFIGWLCIKIFGISFLLHP